MGPPNNRTSIPANLSFPFNLDVPAASPASKTSCPTGLCHESPKDPFARPFFSDLALHPHLIAPSAFGAHKSIIVQVNPFLRAEESNPLSVTQNVQAPTINKKQIPPEEAKIFTEKGNEFLNRAHQKGLSFVAQMNHFHTALFNFQMLGDVGKCKTILQEIQGLYEQDKNEFGKSYIQAQLSFLQGDEKGFSEAISSYEQLDAALGDGLSGLSPEKVDAIRGDLKNKLFIAYVSRGQLYSSEGHFQKATLDFEQAFILNPSKAAFQLYAQAAYQAGLFDFKDHDRQIEALRFQRNFLPQEYGTHSCISHHQAPPSDFQVWQQQEKLHAHQVEVDAKISAIQIQSDKNLEKFHQMMALVYPDSNSAERYEKDLATAQFLEQFGRPEEARMAYGRIMTEREASKDSTEILRYATAANRLAGYALQESNSSLARDYSDKSLGALQNIPSSAETQFLMAQAQFIQAESYLKEANLDAGRRILENLKESASLGEKGSLQYQLSGRVFVRLAQVYYSKKETFYLGDRLAEEIKTKFKGEAEVVGDTFFAKALSKVGVGRAMEAVDILREEIQKPYPQSSAARAIAMDSRFKNFLTSYPDEKGQIQYLLKASSEINEKDWSEAFKVAVAKSGEGSTERKAAYAAAGGGSVLAALALAPEPVATKVAAGLVAIGMGVGLLWERFVSASEHGDEIYDAYRMGISTVSDSQNTMNMFLLGADVAMLLTAGMAGSVAKAFVRESLAVAAEEATSTLVLRMGVEVGGEDVMIWAGRGLLFASENVGAGISSYSVYQMEKSLFFRQEFHWDSAEALQWIAMGSVIEGASRLPFLGTAAAEFPLFQRGPLKDIIVNGKIVGQTSAEGLAAKWLVDAGFGLSAYYSFAHSEQNYADFMSHNLFMMGVLHGGGAFARRITRGVPEAFIAKIDKSANESFARAKKNFSQDPPPGGFGLQPAYALAGGGVSAGGELDPSKASAVASSRPPLLPSSFMMGRHNKEKGNAGVKGLGRRVSEKGEVKKSSKVIESLLGLHWRQAIRKAWQLGIPMREGDNIAVYRGPRENPRGRIPREMGHVFDSLSESFKGFRMGRRLNRRLAEVRNIYLSADAATRAKIESSLGIISYEIEKMPPQMGSKVYGLFKDFLDSIISSYGEKVGEVPIQLDSVGLGARVPQREIPGSYAHYTDAQGLKQILAKGQITLHAPMAGRQSRIYVADVDLAPSQVVEKIFIGNRDYKNRGKYVIGFDLAPHVQLQRGVQLAMGGPVPIYELFVSQSLEIGKDIFIRYAGENPLVEVEY